MLAWRILGRRNPRWGDGLQPALETPMNRWRRTMRFAIVAVSAVMAEPGCGGKTPPPPAAAPAPASAGALDAARLAAASNEPDQWFTPGRDTSGAYYSPLGDIN